MCLDDSNAALIPTPKSRQQGVYGLWVKGEGVIVDKSLEMTIPFTTQTPPPECLFVLQQAARWFFRRQILVVAQFQLIGARLVVLIFTYVIINIILSLTFLWETLNEYKLRFAFPFFMSLFSPFVILFYILSFNFFVHWFYITNNLNNYPFVLTLFLFFHQYVIIYHKKNILKTKKKLTAHSLEVQRAW